VEPEQLPSPWCIQQAGAHHRLVLDPAGAPPPTVSPGDVVALAVGPEGGLTEKELEAFQAGGFTPVSLGRRRLRAETAALVSVSMLTLPLETGPREHEQQ
jgi:RsmE family RNA methyltransferase